MACQRQSKMIKPSYGELKKHQHSAVTEAANCFLYFTLVVPSRGVCVCVCIVQSVVAIFSAHICHYHCVKIYSPDSHNLLLLALFFHNMLPQSFSYSLRRSLSCYTAFALSISSKDQSQLKSISFLPSEFSMPLFCVCVCVQISAHEKKNALNFFTEHK